MGRTVRRPRGSGKGTGSADPEEKPSGENGADGDAPEAEVDVRMRGPAGAVRDAAGRLASEADTEDREEETRGDDDVDDPIAELLANPRNIVVVKRLKPREWHGRRSAGVVDNYECPIDKDEIEGDVLDRHGGHWYKATVHPNTAGGQAKILDAWTFSDDRIDPILPGSDDGIVDTAEDSEVDADQPIEIARNAIKRKMQFLTDKAQLKEAEIALRQLEEQDPKPEKDGGRDRRDDRIRELEEQAKMKEIKEQMEARLGPLERSISDLSSAMTRFLDSQANKPQQDDGTKNLLLQMIQSGDTRFNTLMSNFTAAITKQNAPPPKQEGWREMMTDLKTMKDLFGSEDSRVKNLEERLLDLALSRIEDGGGGGGGGGNEEEDPIKFAVKELSPVFRTYVEKKLENEGKEKVREMTPDEKKAYFKRAAAEEARRLEEEWKKKGYIVKIPASSGASTKKIPQAPPKKTDEQKRKEAEAAAQLGKTKTVEVEAADTTSKPPVPSDEPPLDQDQEGGDVGRYAHMPHIGKVEVPPSPHEEGYNRQQAVDYVLDGIRSEIMQKVPQTKPEDSYVVADALDLFDDELLFNISQVETGTQLEEALAPWGDDGKIAQIKQAGNSDERVQSWLKRVIVTLQDEWKRKASKPPVK